MPKAEKSQDVLRGEILPAQASQPSLFGDDALSSVTSFDDALSLLSEADVVADFASDYGTGFTVCEDKALLVGVPFVILEWRENEGDFGPFVSAAVVTEDGRKLILNDGSATSGLRVDLAHIAERRTAAGNIRPRVGLLCKQGLTRSDYDYVAENGARIPATSYYLAH